MGRSFSVGDVILCNFPTEESPGIPGPKTRPCLVVGVQKGNVYRGGRIEVAYGTTSNKRKPGLSLRLEKEEDLLLAGLDRPSKFLLSKRAQISLRGGFLRSKLGALPERFITFLRKQLDGEDIADRFEARRFGRKQQKHAWAPSPEPQKELTHA